MKKLLAVLTTAILFASCNTGNNDAEMYKRQVDSLSSIIASRPELAGKPKTTTGFAETSDALTIQQFPSDSLLEAIKIDTGTANIAIQKFHKYIKDHMPHAINTMSFIVNAEVLRNYILNDASVANVVVYIGMTPREELQLIYIGAKDDGTGKITEIPFTISGNATVNAYDNAMPCPTCGKDGIHTAPMHDD